MSGQKLSAKDEQRIVNKLNKLQVEQTMETTLDLTNKCFQACITNFRIRKLDDDEELCVYKCISLNYKFQIIILHKFAFL
ncbi:mitochondrial import inner membrane translocase subunit 9 [Tieghemostelium lacteum]|uniref:Mitochondrial import inner membrane translocase subunit n=1 Tax=Tieghemostelium lacteum TaxID=361077 RepID=A0A152A473_TIELA|nr:mitochondrial import inner membrane translocase subunit 9 [Tieghemostelium lacteum]|eukprot:KYR01048.1 mitochondrial import inner membrane translocase subunit 9 [Tieghemostelium lacteum]